MAMFEHKYNAGSTRALSDNLEVVEGCNRILQEVSCAASCWGDVENILQAHRQFYFSLSLRVREYLNERIKDAMAER